MRRCGLLGARQVGNARVLVVVVLTCLAGAAAVFMVQEKDARSQSQATSEILGEMIDSGASPTPEQVQEKLGRAPHTTRVPARHRYVEEYHWKGPFTSHTVYAYYRTAATKLLEAVSLNQKLDDWEGE